MLLKDEVYTRMRRLKQTRLGQIMRVYVKRYLYNAPYSKKLQAFNFPPEVWIENTNCCNANCVMCPRDKHTREQGFMDFALYEKLIKEIAQHKDIVKRVHMHNFGEPLLDKKLPDRIRLAKDLGIHHIYFVTNGSILTPELSRALIESGLDEFKISFYGTDKETYNRTMRGLDFDATIDNVRTFFKIRTELNRTRPKIIIQYLPQESNRERIADFKKLFENVINKNIGDDINIFSLHNFGDGRCYHTFVSGVCSICNYPWRTMVILHDGKVTSCCLDYNGVQIIGDVKTSTMREIWNGPTYTKIRSDFKQLQYKGYPSCLNCAQIR